MWNPFAKGEMPQLLSGLKASIFTLVSHNAQTKFQYQFLEERF